MGIKKEKKEMVLPPPGRRAHDEKCFLLIMVSVEPPLPPSLTCRDLLAAHLVFPTPGLAGERVEKTTLLVGLGTQRVGVGVRGRMVRGSLRTGLRQVILPFPVYKVSVGGGGGASGVHDQQIR